MMPPVATPCGPACAHGVQDVVDVHDVQEDMIRRGTHGEKEKGVAGVEAADAQDAATNERDLAEQPSTAGKAMNVEPEEAGTTAEDAASGWGDDGSKPGCTQATSAPLVLDELRQSGPSSAWDTTVAEINVEDLEDVSSEDWGLDMLVRVGESWAPNLLLMTPCAASPMHAVLHTKRPCSPCWLIQCAAWHMISRRTVQGQRQGAAAEAV
jgi:hypothetical protein